uniref:Tubulin-specific chaperone D n=1 Tax=Ditylenchus dipsaci TaxID=166011 RepID=A0A915CUZ3_9BILA
MDVIGCTPIQLEKGHVKEMRHLIQNLTLAAETSATNERNLERFEKLVMLYSDEPQLLDPILREAVDSLLPFISWPNDSKTLFSILSLAALSRLRVVTRTRGYKVMIRMLPHEVTHLNHILLCLEYYAQKASQPCCTGDGDRRTIFMLTVWLLIICKNPFSLAKFDSSSGQEKPIAERIVDCMSTLQNHNIPQGELKVVSTLPRISEYFEVLRKFDSETDGGSVLITNLRILISLFKWGKRKEMRPYGLELLRSVSSQVLSMDCMNIEVRNLVTKLLQRVALVLLKPRLASWRYKCGFRSLEESLKGRREIEMDDQRNGKAEKHEEDAEENSGEIPYNEIETIISEVLLRINDRDNIVRWTAAKGKWLPQSFPPVLSLQWLGHLAWGCLAIAELCRRGCLLPDQVPQVVAVLSKALLFEQSHIGFSVSMNVRDAACYICWAFARAYEAKVLKQHLKSLAGELVCLALFDREVNIRRAASAAFQENVEEMTVSQKLAVRVAEYKDYRIPMLNHLLEHKILHWDESVRELAADSLQQLVSFDVEYTKHTILPNYVLVSTIVMPRRAWYPADSGTVCCPNSTYGFSAERLPRHPGQSGERQEQEIAQLCRQCIYCPHALLQSPQRFELLIQRIFNKYFHGIEQTNQDELQRCAKMPSEYTTETTGASTLLKVIIVRLLKVVYDKSTPKWVFARVSALETITTLLIDRAEPNFDWMEVVQSCIYLADDYTCTVNGDIGRFGRRAAILALGKLLRPAISSEASLAQPTVDLAIGKILQRCCEPIDDLRHTACSTMTDLLELCLLPIQEREDEHPGHHQEDFSDVDWKHSRGFMKLVRLLDSKLYKQYALEGLILSAGSVSEWMSQSALLAIVHHLRPIKKDVEKMEIFLEDVLTIFYRLKQRSDPACVLQLLNCLLIERVFAVYEKSPDDWPVFVQLNHEVLKVAVNKGRPKIKSMAIQVVGCLLQVDPKSQVFKKCLSLIISMLDSPYSALREVAMEQLFEALSGLIDETIYSSVDQETAIQLLRETPWTNTNESDVITKARDQLHELLLPE